MGASYGPVGTYSYCSSIISCHSFVPCGAQCKTTRKMRRPKELLLRCTQPRTAREDHRIDADATEHPCLRCTYGTRCCNSDRRQWKRRDEYTDICTPTDHGSFHHRPVASETARARTGCTGHSPTAETRMGARRRIRLYLYRAAKAWAHYHRGRGLMHA
jgi:hypothetical protein